MKLSKEKLWEAYSKKKTTELREQIIIEYAPLVKIVAGRLNMHLGYHVEYEDLCSYGIMGLIDAVDKFDLSKEVKFETYASLRIRGAILDQIRKMDWIPRTIRQRQRSIDEAARTVEERTGNIPTEEEIAAELQITNEELLKWRGQLQATNVVSLDEFVEAGQEPVMDARSNSHFSSPEAALEEKELKAKLAEALEMLTEKENKVIMMYYYEELALKEIAAVLDVSESRVSQLHTKAIEKMRKILGDYLGLILKA